MRRVPQKREPRHTSINPRDIEVAKESSNILSSLLKTDHCEYDLRYLQYNDPDNLKIISLPEPALNMLLQILTEMSRGNMVKITPQHSELTTQEAADILNVSRPFVIKQLDEGKIPYKMIGTRRKILFQDLMEYQESIYRVRLNTLDKLTRDAEDLDMGY